MATEVIMPKLGLTMRKGIVRQWLKSEGDTVEKGVQLLIIETEKVKRTIEAPASGKLLRIDAPVKSTVPVGQILGYIGEPGEQLPETQIRVEVPAIQPRLQEPSMATARVMATPKAKALAKKEGIDLGTLSGTGPGGLLTEEDVKRHVDDEMRHTKSGLTVKQTISMTPLRLTIAERMTESLREMAQLTLIRETRADLLVEMRNHLLPKLEEEIGKRVTYTHMLIMLVGQVLKQFPLINSTLENDRIKMIDEVNIGFAVAVEDGLVAPVIRDAPGKSLKVIVAEENDLSTKARNGQLALEDVSNGTFTITNLGMFGVDGFTPIVYPTQVGILGVGRIIERPVAIGGKVEIKPMLTLSFTFDHRVIDGHLAAQFLDTLSRIIESYDELSKALTHE